MTDPQATTAPTDDLDAFIDPLSMEEDPAELFAGDSGTLDADVRRVLVRLLQRRFLLAERSPVQWRTLLANQQVVESRLHDLFVHLVVDHDRGIAYKRQVRTAEVDVPVLLRDEAYTRAETLVLVHLRTVFQREQGAGETSVRVDVEEIEQTALTYFDPDETNLAARQREIRGAVARLAKEGIIEEESEGRYRVTALVEVVLSNERLAELRSWLRAGGITAEPDDADDTGPDDVDDNGPDDADDTGPDDADDNGPDDVDDVGRDDVDDAAPGDPEPGETPAGPDTGTDDRPATEEVAR